MLNHFDEINSWLRFSLLPSWNFHNNNYFRIFLLVIIVGSLAFILLRDKSNKIKIFISTITMLVVVTMVLISLGNNLIFTRHYDFMKKSDFIDASQMHNTEKVLSLYTREYQQSKTEQYKDYNKMFNYKYYLSKNKLSDKQVKFANSQIKNLKANIATANKNNKHLNYIDDKYSAYLSDDILLPYVDIQDTINQLTSYDKAKVNNNLQKEIKAELSSIK